jgi:hypothetical protein
MSDQVTQIVGFYVTDAETGDERQVGQAEFSPTGMLSLLEADPDMAGKLAAAIRSVNAKDAIVEVSPETPPDDGDEVAAADDDSGSYGSSSLVTARGDAGFVDALSRYLERYYGFSLA